jgi:hypothetical protein
MAIAADHNKFVFNDYVSPIAADDLIKVAVKKQEMYDEGRKQIKQVYDQYGKMRSMIVNDNARNYFDQELGKLFKNIQQNAGLDFANLGNVEAVINLGKPFENDEYIKNALENGLEYQKRTSELSGLGKDQRSADNDLVYMYDMNEYMNNGGLDTKVTKNKSYPKFIDISEKMRLAEKEVEGDEFTTYEQGPRGYIQEIQHKQKKREDIQRRLMESLTPEEMSQFQIHAQADMLKLGKDAVYQTWVGHNKENKLVADQTRKEAMQELGRLRSIPKPTAEQLAQIRTLESIRKQSEDTISAADQNIGMNPDEFDMGEYLPFYTKRFVDGMASKLAFNKTKSALKEDKIYMANYEHGLDLSRIKAQGQEQRNTAIFKEDLENFQVQSTASIGNLKGIGQYLPKNSVDATKSPVEQIDQMINAIGKVKMTATLKNKYMSDLKQLKDLYSGLGSAQPNDKVSFNRYQGAGQVQTSVSDLLGTPVIDVINSGRTLEYLKRTNSGSKSTKTSFEKAQEKLNDRVEQLKLTGKTQDEAETQAKAELAKDKSALSSSNNQYIDPDKPL